MVPNMASGSAAPGLSCFQRCPFQIISATQNQEPTTTSTTPR